MLSISDIVTLASQGYKPSDVKELINMSKDAEARQSKPEQGQTVGDQSTAEPESNPSTDGTAGENPVQSKPAEHVEAGNDNKQIEDLQKQLAEANAKLAEAQKQNINRDISGTDKKTDEQLVSDWIRSVL